MVFITFLVLTGLSAVAMITGFVWMLAASGRTRRRSGPEVGAEIMGGQMAEEGETLAEGTVFKGKGVAVSREVDLSFAEIKGMIRARRPEAVPALLAAGGLLCLVLFGAVALWLGLEDKLVGTLFALVVLYTVGRIVVSFVRA